MIISPDPYSFDVGKKNKISVQANSDPYAFDLDGPPKKGNKNPYDFDFDEPQPILQQGKKD